MTDTGIALEFPSGAIGPEGARAYVQDCTPIELSPLNTKQRHAFHSRAGNRELISRRAIVLWSRYPQMRICWQADCLD